MSDSNCEDFRPANLRRTHSNGHCPRLAISMGDPGGIGPEVILKALADPTMGQDYDITIVGSRKQLTHTYHCLQERYPQGSGGPSPSATQRWVDPQELKILDLDSSGPSPFQLGQPSTESGAASFTYVDQAITRTLAGEFQGIVTGPIAKSSWKQAGHPYAGQTELLAEKAGVTRFGMLFVARSPHTQWQLRTLLATTHIPLDQVPQTLSADLLSTKLDLLIDCLGQDFGIDTPCIALAGLNPHSGEQGQLGREEVDWIIDWVKDSRSRYPQVTLEGPIPPDTLWVKPGQAWYGPSGSAELSCQGAPAHDAYLALYHDQGLIPVKLMAFDRAVNTTIGLPFVRTSPDHGTAFDIAGQGIADATSMKAAIQLAAELVDRRQQSQRLPSGTSPTLASP